MVDNGWISVKFGRVPINSSQFRFVLAEMQRNSQEFWLACFIRADRNTETILFMQTLFAVLISFPSLP